MKLTDITLKNISSFLEGNYKYYKDKFFTYPDYLKEQVIYRLSKCEKDCLKLDECINCGCNPRKKAFVVDSCNPDRFPDLMDKEDWDKFKKENNIEIDESDYSKI